MDKLYMNILIESLEKKARVLDEIIVVGEKQHEDLEDPNLEPEEFDRTVEEKAKLLDQLEELDNGFEEVFARVKNEMHANKEAHREEIGKLQTLIRKVTDKSLVIQRQEAQNKELMEKKISSVRTQAKEVRKSQKIVNQYYKSMMKTSFLDPQFVDNKK